MNQQHKNFYPTNLGLFTARDSVRAKRVSGRDFSTPPRAHENDAQGARGISRKESSGRGKTAGGTPALQDGRGDHEREEPCPPERQPLQMQRPWGSAHRKDLGFRGGGQCVPQRARVTHARLDMLGFSKGASA